MSGRKAEETWKRQDSSFLHSDDAKPSRFKFNINKRRLLAMLSFVRD